MCVPRHVLTLEALTTFLLFFFQVQVRRHVFESVCVCMSVCAAVLMNSRVGFIFSFRGVFVSCFCATASPTFPSSFSFPPCSIAASLGSVRRWREKGEGGGGGSARCGAGQVWVPCVRVRAHGCMCVCVCVFLFWEACLAEPPSSPHHPSPLPPSTSQPTPPSLLSTPILPPSTSSSSVPQQGYVCVCMCVCVYSGSGCTLFTSSSLHLPVPSRFVSFPVNAG